MEKYENTATKETLVLTKAVFNVLLSKIIEHFKEKYAINVSRYKENQLYGFGNYDLEQPNLKEDFELVLKGYVNGKYLYNKNREVSTGKPFVKISREYKYVFFNYLGFKDIYEFIDQDFFNSSQKTKQLELLNQENNVEDYYYVSYYFGEDKRMSKGQVIIYKQWKNVEMKYIYKDKYGKTGTYSFFGSITYSEGFVFFDTKVYVGSKKNEGAKFVFFIGKSAPYERDFLIGTYSGFDKYYNTIAGKMILKKSNSREQMEEETASKYFDPIISQELNKKRIIVESVVRKNPLLFSAKSPYAQVLNSISGKYLVRFYNEKSPYKIKLNIEKYHLNVKSLNDSLIINDDQISLINNGQIVHLDFSIKGLFYIQKASIYIKIYDLLEGSNTSASGKFTAIDINNEILSGIVKFKKMKS